MQTLFFTLAIVSVTGMVAYYFLTNKKKVSPVFKKQESKPSEVSEKPEEASNQESYPENPRPDSSSENN